MTKKAYKLALLGSLALGVLSAILFAFDQTRVGLVVLALDVATIPVLFYLQNRISIINTRTIVRRNSGGFAISAPTNAADAASVEALRKEVAELVKITRANANPQMSVYANEIRREARMVRLSADSLIDNIDRLRVEG